MAMNVVEKTASMVPPLTALAAIDALLGAQAVDLREPVDDKPIRYSMGRGAQRLYEALRVEVPMLDTDRPTGPDIEAALAVLREVCHPRASVDPASLGVWQPTTESRWVPRSEGTTTNAGTTEP